jgi:hypothetical protein
MCWLYLLHSQTEDFASTQIILRGNFPLFFCGYVKKKKKKKKINLLRNDRCILKSGGKY